MERIRLVITGHIDHGKSTLIGRLFFDTGGIREDKLAEIKRASEEAGRPLEFAFFADHLREERARGITIDTAQYRILLPNRELTIIDAPGHREFLRNMLTGASQADGAVLLVDAVEGVREQTRRHAYLLNLIGCRNVIACINKMDLVGWDEGRFMEVCDDLLGFADQADVTITHCIPTAASAGEGIVRSQRTSAPWYHGPALLQALDEGTLPRQAEGVPLVFTVQDVYTHDRPVAVGRVLAGSISRGENCIVARGGRPRRVEELRALNGPPTSFSRGESAALVLDGPVTRGDVLAGTGAPVRSVQRVEATLFWLDDAPLGEAGMLQWECSTQCVPVTAIEISRRLDSSTLEEQDPRGALGPTEVATVSIMLAEPASVAPFVREPELGRFVLTRRGRTVAGGIVKSVEGVID